MDTRTYSGCSEEAHAAKDKMDKADHLAAKLAH